MSSEIADIMRKAGSHNRLRGFVSNISNYNPFHLDEAPAYAEDNLSFDESRYVTYLSEYLQGYGLPTRFIIDQGRVAVEGTREDWSQWCNVYPAGFGSPPTTATDNSLVDSIVWVKVPGESDGRCGMPGAPRAGGWFEAYAQMLVENAHPDVLSVEVRV